MKLLCFIKAAALCMVVVAPAWAIGSRSLDRDNGMWAPISLKVPVYRKCLATLQVQPRFQNAPERNFTEAIIRTGVGFRLNERWSVFAGYYWSNRTNPAFNLERRLWQEVDYNHKIGKYTINHRFRLEEIQREKFVGSALRARHRIKLSYPLGGPKSKNYLAVFEEPFLNLNSPKNGPERGLSQNRIFIGMGRRVSRTIKVESGYLNQYKINSGRTPNLVNHALLVQVSIDLTKLKKKKPSNTQLASKITY